MADDVATAEQVAAQINLELSASAADLILVSGRFGPRSAAVLHRLPRARHASSLATVSRYRAATQHLVNFSMAVAAGSPQPAHELDVEGFVRYLRGVRVAPNGHAHARRRPLRDNGVRYILETCRSLYGYAAKWRHLPPYTDNPFSGLGGKRGRVDDAKPVFVFDERLNWRF